MSATGNARPRNGVIRFAQTRPEEKPLQLLIIDPMLLTRGCLIAAIQSADPHASITGVASIEDAAPAIRDGASYDAVLINLSANGRSGDSLKAAIGPVRAALPDNALILLAGSGEQADIAAAFREGVRGYLTAETRLTTTVDAIRLVCAGWAIHPPLQMSGLGELDAEDRQRPAWSTLLTPRQLQVLRLLAKGMPNKSIAFALDMSERTVKAHVKAIMQRLGAANRTQIVARLSNLEL